MKHYKDIVVPEHVSTYLDKTICDLCNQEIKRKLWTIDEVTIERELGSHYPECLQTSTYSVDVCGECFESKLVPWLKEQGASIQEKDNG